MKNKYNIGDQVWFMRDNKAVKDKITMIGVIGGKVYYRFFENSWTSTLRDGVSELDVYPTRDNLIEWL